MTTWNFGQSSNDVIPTAIHVAAVAAIIEKTWCPPWPAGQLARGQGRRVR